MLMLASPYASFITGQVRCLCSWDSHVGIHMALLDLHLQAVRCVSMRPLSLSALTLMPELMGK